MSDLSERELAAGISRRALESIVGDGRAPVDIAGPEKIVVLDTWNRQLVVLDINRFTFAVRDTVHVNDKPQTVMIYLTRPELEMLGRRINQVLWKGTGVTDGEASSADSESGRRPKMRQALHDAG